MVKTESFFNFWTEILYSPRFLEGKSEQPEIMAHG